MTRSLRWDDLLDDELRDPALAAEYLTACLEGGDPEVFLLALRHVARARSGGLAQLALETELNREHLYRMLSAKGNPAIRSLAEVLDALGLQLAVKCKDAG